MDLKQLFIEIHGTVNPETWISLRKNNSTLTNLLTKLGIDENHLWEDENAIIHKYFFWDGLYLYNLFVTDVERESFIERMVSGLEVNAFKFADIKRQKKYVQLFGMIDKKVLFYTFNKFYNEIPDDQKWEAYKAAHIRAETGFDELNPIILKDLLTVQAYKSKERISRLNRLKFKIKDKPFIIYHGHNEEYNPKDEISWTLDKKTALFFAYRFDNEAGIISQKTITINDVLDYFPDRNEDEIILIAK